MEDAPPIAVPCRLLCDEMLAGLARWLRAAGHDATVAPKGMADSRVLARAATEGRVLLTLDRGLMQHASAAGVAVLLHSQDLDHQAAELHRRLRIDWEYAPFTRCLICNTVLRPASIEARQGLPEAARRLPGPVRECPTCERVYWPGSHVRRMARRLTAWARPNVGDRREL